MEILELGKTPVSAESPAGEDVAYAPEFDALQNEIDKLTIVTADAGQVDWKRVLELSAFLLANKSKNLLVAAYMAEALMKTRQFEGLYQGSVVLKDLVENYWDTCFPPKKRKKGRLNAFNWWSERVGRFLRESEFPPLPPALVDETRQALTLLDSLLAEKIEDAPILRPLIQQLDRVPMDVPEPQPTEAQPSETQPTDTQPSVDIDAVETKVETAAIPEPEKPAPPKPQPAPAFQAPDLPAGVDKPQSDKEADKVLNSALDTMAKLATHYLKVNAANPMAYHLNRINAWLTVDALPMIQEGVKTPLSPPDAMIKTSLEQQIGAADYENAVVFAESRLREFRFWLDLNRFAAQGLDALGGKYTAAHDIVCRETAMFVKKLPAVETLAFSDGTPFADRETRSWLKSLRAADAPGEALAGPAIGGDAGSMSRFQETEAEAGQLVKKKQVVEAIQLFQEKMRNCGSGRDRVLFRIGLCRLLLGIGKTELALPHLEALESGIAAHGLEEWEPELALQGLKLIHEGYRECSREEFNNMAGAVFDRIARISPAAAYALCST